MDTDMAADSATDEFIDRAEQELARLRQEHGQLAERIANMRNEQASIEPQIKALERTLQTYRDLMGLQSTPVVATAQELPPDPTIADRAYQVLIRAPGGRMRVAQIADDIGSEYATVYRSISRDPRFTRDLGEPGWFKLGPSDEEVLRTIADLQLRNPPPDRYVGLKGLAESRGWQSKLGDLMKRGLVLDYQRPNERVPEHPIRAIRVNTASADARELLGAEAAALDRLQYESGG